MTLGERCIEEAIRLHVFLEGWLVGRLARTPETFAAFADALSDACEVISPLGSVTGRGDLLPEFEATHGVLADSADIFAIRVENARVLRAWPDHALVTYEEWHDLGNDTSARLSTALYLADPAAPLGVSWRHILETWLPGRAPKGGERFPTA
ncbi:MAG: hypothetical protein AAF264_03835 [Pseudomonadota bacterium]